MAIKSAAEIVVESLAVNGIETLFCLPGIQNDPFFAALYDSEIKAINARHEQGVAYMALGAALATGKPQGFAVVPGPGFLNTTSALATAYATGAPVLCLAGEVAMAAIGKGYGQLHELPDQMGIMSRLTKWSGRISSASDAASQMATAFCEMQSGRPRPVGIEVPMDVWNDEVDFGYAEASVPVPAPEADLEDISRAVTLIDEAEHILIVVGGGAQGASAEIQALAERLEAPVVCYRNGQGVLDGRHPLAQTGPFGHRLWPEINLVIGIGTRLSAQLQGWGTDDDLKILRIDIDPEEVTRIAPADVAIIGDAAAETGRLVSALEKRKVQRTRWQKIAATADAMSEEIGGLTPQVEWLAAIREALGEDGIYVDELTQPGYVSRLAYPTYKPRTFVSSGYMGTLGWGYAAALGVKAVKPDAPVVSVSGDGGFLFTGNEIATAVHHGINLVTIVFTDGAYGNVQRIQQQMYDNKVIASELTNPDFVAYAESFGAAGLRAEKPEQLEGKIKQALALERPTIIEVPMGDVPSPWPFLMLPKVRGV